MSARKGFTLVEMAVVMAIMLIIGAAVVVNLAKRRVDTDLVATAQQIATTLRQAQSDAMAQEGNLQWGVRFVNATTTRPYYALFKGSFATGTVGRYALPSTVAYQAATLASGATVDVIFSQISGVPSAPATIGLYMPNENAAYSSTISVSAVGQVSY